MLRNAPPYFSKVTWWVKASLIFCLSFALSLERAEGRVDVPLVRVAVVEVATGGGAAVDFRFRELAVALVAAGGGGGGGGDG